MAMMSMSSTTRFHVEFLATDFVGTAVRPLLMPVLFGFCDYLYPVNRSRAVVLYGAILSIARLAEILGTELVPAETSRTRDLAAFSLAFGAFILAFSTNIFVVISSIFVIFLSSSCMKTWFASYESHWRHLSSSSHLSAQDWSQGVGLGSGSGSGRYLDAAGDKSIFSPEGYIKRMLFAFAFISLLSCYLYTDDKDSSFPQFQLCFYYSCFVFLATLLLYTTSKLMIEKRKNASPLQGFGGNSTAGRKARKSKGAVSSASFDVEAANRLPVPDEFITLAKGDAAKGRTLFINSLRWRSEFNVESILETPQPSFSNITALYPHAIHGRSKDDCVVLYEVLGKAKTRELQERGVTTDDLVWYFTLRNEFVFQNMRLPGDATLPAGSPPKFQRVMSVLDVKGISLTDITGDVVSFIQRSSELLDNYYPGRIARVVIVNSPWWFQSAWSTVAKVLSESVTAKIAITKGCAGLNEFIDPSQRPREYEGTDDKELGQSPEHLRFLKLPDLWRASGAGDDDESIEGDAGSNGGVNAGGGGGSINGGGGSSNDKKGVWNWMKSFVVSDKKAATVAYLGERNRFKFDSKTRQWVMEAEAEDADEDLEGEEHVRLYGTPLKDSTRGGIVRRPGAHLAFKPATADSDLEEHALLLAIQAAQIVQLNAKTQKFNNMSADKELGGLHELGLHSNFSSSSSLSSSSISSSSSLHAPHINVFDLEADTGGQQGYHQGGGVGQARQQADSTNPYVLIAAGSMYLIAAVCQQLFLALIPVFLSIPIDVGGAGYSVVDLGILVSSVSMLLLLVDIYWNDKISSSLKLSPLRVIRVACLLIIVSCIMLPMVLRTSDSALAFNNNQPTQPLMAEYMGAVTMTKSMDASTGILGGTSSENSVASSSGLHSNPSSSSSSLSSSINISAIPEPLMATLLPVTASPSRSIFNVPIPCVFLAALFSCSHLVRIISGMLLEVALSSVAIQSPKLIIKSLHFTISVLTPLCSAVMYALLINNHFASPLNASSVFALPICAVSLIYIVTLMVSIQFRGDFGYIPDILETASSLPAGIGFSGFSSSCGSSTPSSSAIPSSICGPSSACDWRVVVEDLMRIPLDDAAFFVASSSSGPLYSMKLQTMKVDLKEL